MYIFIEVNNGQQRDDGIRNDNNGECWVSVIAHTCCVLLLSVEGNHQKGNKGPNREAGSTWVSCLLSFGLDSVNQISCNIIFPLVEAWDPIRYLAHRWSFY